MAKMRDVLSFFKDLTGHEFFPEPNPGIFGKILPNGRTIKDAVELVECIIDEQEEHLGCRHRTAQENTSASLSDKAEVLYASLVEWAKPVDVSMSSNEL